MFLYLSKALTWLVDPFLFFSVLILLGFVFLIFNKIRLAKIFSTLAFLFALIFGSLPVTGYMYDFLENRFPIPQNLPDKIEGIIVLGGMVDVKITRARGQLSLNGNVERITSLVNLTQKYPNTTVLFTGGSGLLDKPGYKEGQEVLPLLQAVVQEGNHIIIENEARNTHENGILTKKKIKPDQTGPWLLVTSAFHMPRSVGVFRKQEINIIPYPVDFKNSTRQSFHISTSPLASFPRFGFILHEWLGLFAYYLTDKTSELFPAP